MCVWCMCVCMCVVCKCVYAYSVCIGRRVWSGGGGGVVRMVVEGVSLLKIIIINN